MLDSPGGAIPVSSRYLTSSWALNAWAGRERNRRECAVAHGNTASPSKRHIEYWLIQTPYWQTIELPDGYLRRIGRTGLSPHIMYLYKISLSRFRMMAQ